MKQTIVNVIAPLQGPGLLPLVEAYLRLARAPGDASSSVTISRVFEWRTDGTQPGRGSPLLPLNNLLVYGNGIQRLSSGSAGVTKASPKK